MVDASAGKDARQHASPGAIHAINCIFLPRAGDAIKIGENRDGLDIGLKKVSLADGGA